MGEHDHEKSGFKENIKPALWISLIFGVVAGVITLIATNGGVHSGMSFRMAGIAFLIAFVAGVLFISLMMMVAKENPDEMGRGSGVNRSSQLSDEELDAIEAEERRQRREGH